TVAWGIPSHFGYDPTCLVFRGNFDVSCWTVDFQPKIRIFSTLGQPAWMAAYLAVLIPVALGFALIFKKERKDKSLLSFLFVGLSSAFFLAFLWTRTRSGVIGLGIALLFFFGSILFIQREKISKKFIGKQYIIVVTILLFAAIGFFAQVPLSPFDKISYQNFKSQIQKEAPKALTPEETPHSGPLGGTDSGKIRLIVWRGALDIWRKNPIFGTGVETYAYAYYKNRPPEHNLTSEWNFLYNKAHNEYLNYLATTGAFGFISYLLIIGIFLGLYFYILLNKKIGNIEKLFNKLGVQVNKDSVKNARDPLVISTVAGFITILVTNFFGFSVVIMNIYLFLIPVFVFIMLSILPSRTLGFSGKSGTDVGMFQWSGIVVLFLTSGYLLYFLFKFWIADTAYALGSNYSKAGEYQLAYPLLHQAVATKAEPVFRDEMAYNDTALAVTLLSSPGEQNATESANLAQQLVGSAVAISDQLVLEHPNNIVFWKSRTRIFYTLAQVNPSYYPLALEAMKKTYELGGNEASISYNLGVLYGQNNELEKAVEILEKTVKLKPDYRDAHYALGLFYNELSLGADRTTVEKPEFRKKAMDQMQYILDNISKDDPEAKDSIQAWK
ncbi:MAG: O-antigen ligase family protein, partial [Candidatus Levybacteria bacterium]|nr:O-antigen ligase family protein [Candidatus Levybacteria bacterium]